MSKRSNGDGEEGKRTRLTSEIGLVGLAVMGQNLALNIAEKGFPISVFNRSPDKVDATIERAQAEGNLPLRGFKDMGAFVASLDRPRRVIILVKAGQAVDETIAQLTAFLEPGDIIIDGGNEWYPNTERRAAEAAKRGLLYVGMGVSGGEEGARHGPSLMPGGPAEAYAVLEPILRRVAAQVDDGPCVTHIGPGGSGNYVKMVHNGIEYGDMQIIAEAYDVLRTVGGLSNEELHAVFAEWNRGELQSFLIEITAKIFARRDDVAGTGHLVDKVLDMTGMKGTGMWTVKEFVERMVPAATISASLDARYLSAMKEERVSASKILGGPTPSASASASVDKKQLIDDVRQAVYASKICSYAQGMNLIRQAGVENKWKLNLGAIARIWKGGCIIRAVFLDRIKAAYDRNPALPSLLVDSEFARELNERQAAWRRVITLAVANGVAVPSFSGSLGFFDSYRRANLPSNLIQAQRDLFGAHTYKRNDGVDGDWHSDWSPTGTSAKI